MNEEVRMEIDNMRQSILNLENMIYSLTDRLYEFNTAYQEKFDDLEYRINISQNQISNDVIDQINETVTRAYENNKSFH